MVISYNLYDFPETHIDFSAYLQYLLRIGAWNLNIMLLKECDWIPMLVIACPFFPGGNLFSCD